MTDGRYESIAAKRPAGFDSRLLWTQTHPQFRSIDAEVRFKESCPFHDLRASGQFQPEPVLPVDNHRIIAATDLCKRPAGHLMNTGTAKNANFGCGGSIMPEETEPLPPPPLPKRSGAPWTTTAKAAPLFSAPEYVSCPPIAPLRPPVEPPFHTGAAGSKMGLPFPYMPDDAKKPAPPRVFRLKAGTFKPATAPAATLPALDATTYVNPLHDRAARTTERKQRKALKPRQPYVDSRSLLGTFSQYPRHIPEPYHEASLRKPRGGTLFTYWAKSKRCAPIAVPWTSMVQTGEPVVVTAGGGSGGRDGKN